MAHRTQRMQNMVDKVNGNGNGNDSIAISSLNQPKEKYHIDPKDKYKAHKETYTKKYNLPAYEGNEPTEPFKKYVSEFAQEKYERPSLIAKLDIEE